MKERDWVFLKIEHDSLAVHSIGMVMDVKINTVEVKWYCQDSAFIKVVPRNKVQLCDIEQEIRDLQTLIDEALRLGDQEWFYDLTERKKVLELLNPQRNLI